MAPPGGVKRATAKARLSRKSSQVSRGKAGGVIRRIGAVSSGKAAAAKPLVTRHARALLPALFRHSQGKPFRAQALRSFLRQHVVGRGFQLPTVDEAERLLRSLTKTHRPAGERPPPPSSPASSPGAPPAASLGAWQPTGVRYVDPEGSAAVSNLQGYVQGPKNTSSSWVAWNEYGLVYRLRALAGRGGAGDGAASYEIVCTKAFKRLSCTVQRRTLSSATVEGKQAEFKSSIVLEPRRAGVGRVDPSWTLIFLHSFSNKGAEYQDFPHYFGVSGAAVRVVLPTAPQQEQTCFKDWMVWRGKKLRWRRIKFNSWFDYLTDRAGKRENDICIQSALEMRARIHDLIRQEVQRLGDPKRVIVGGASQGCCVALDAALTYPEELGGCIGLVGHLLGSTPLEPSKKNMPLHLYHEANDQEMKWGWVKKTVQRLQDEGFNVTSKRESDPSGSGHWIQEIEGRWIRTALRRIVQGSAAA